MARIKNRAERRQANHRYLNAHRRLNEYTPPSGDEDETYLRLNAEVVDAERDVSWWTQIRTVL